MYRDLDNFTGEMLGILGGVVLIFIVIVVLYLLTLQNLLKNISPENRKMPPSNVWLMFIPVFNIVYQFIMVGKIADSLDAEFKKRGIDCGEARPGYNLGLAYCILYLAGNLPSVLGSLASLAGLICWITYWVKMANYKNQLGPLPDDSILDSNL